MRAIDRERSYGAIAHLAAHTRYIGVNSDALAREIVDADCEHLWLQCLMDKMMRSRGERV